MAESVRKQDCHRDCRTHARFGAAFVSLGMVISDAAARDHSSESAHFEKLLTFLPGHPSSFVQNRERR